jgi:hypothetical protein
MLEIIKDRRRCSQPEVNEKQHTGSRREGVVWGLEPTGY